MHEMKAIAVEAGLDPDLVEQAARLVPVDSSESRLARGLGGPVKYRLDAHFRTKLTDESAAHLLSAVRAAVEQQGAGEADSSGMLWHSIGGQILVTAHAEAEGTRVRVVVDRRGGLIVTGALSLLGALAVAVGVVAAGETGVLESVAIGLSIIAGGAAGSLALARAVWASNSRAMRAKVDALMDTIGRSLAAETGSESASLEAKGGPNLEDDESSIVRLPDGGAP